MEIVFIRHAEKESDEGDVGLSKKGIEQAKNLAKRMSNEKFDEFYCSCLKRSIETANIISSEIGMSPKQECSLNEIEADLIKEEKVNWNQEQVSQYVQLSTFLERFTKMAEENKRILIIAHGNINRLILSILLELSNKNLIRFRLLETGISEVYWVSAFNNWRLKYWNDVSHQPEKLLEGKNKY